MSISLYSPFSHRPYYILFSPITMSSISLGTIVISRKKLKTMVLPNLGVGGRVNRVHCGRLKGGVARFTDVQTCLATNQVVAGYEKLLHNVESSSTICNNFCTCLLPAKANLICDVTPAYVVTPAQFYAIKGQYSRNLDPSTQA